MPFLPAPQTTRTGGVVLSHDRIARTVRMGPDKGMQVAVQVLLGAEHSRSQGMSTMEIGGKLALDTKILWAIGNYFILVSHLNELSA